MFTEKKKIKLKTEDATVDSLWNAQKIHDAGYEYSSAYFTFSKERAEWNLEAHFKRDGEVEKHIFTGFSFGYSGEGPHGLKRFAEIFGIGLSADKIFGRETTPDYGIDFPIKKLSE